jgi:hypothetical protein
MRWKALLALAAGGALAFGGMALAEGGVTITLTDTGPDPVTATVPIGGTVSFVGAGNQNHAIFSQGFTVPFLRPGESSSVRLVTAGRIAYRVTGFYKAANGVIVVTVPNPPVLSAAKEAISYRQSVKLSGTSPLQNLTIGLESRPVGRGVHGKWTHTADLPTGADGSFSTVVTPETSTSYRVSLGAKSFSEAVTVGVGPVLTVTATPRTLKTGRPVHVVAKVEPASAATQLSLSIYDRTRPTPAWRDVARSAVSSTGTAQFTWTATPGKTSLRVHSTRGTAGVGFAPTNSPSILVAATGKAPKPVRHQNPKKPKPKKPKPKKPKS